MIEFDVHGTSVLCVCLHSVVVFHNHFHRVILFWRSESGQTLRKKRVKEGGERDIDLKGVDVSFEVKVFRAVPVLEAQYLCNLVLENLILWNGL